MRGRNEGKKGVSKEKKEGRRKEDNDDSGDNDGGDDNDDDGGGDETSNKPKKPGISDNLRVFQDPMLCPPCLTKGISMHLYNGDVPQCQGPLLILPDFKSRGRRPCLLSPRAISMATHN